MAVSALLTLIEYKIGYSLVLTLLCELFPSRSSSTVTIVHSVMQLLKPY